MPAAVAGSGGHAKTFAAAFALVKGFGLSVDEARPFLREFNARCVPPWNEKDLEHKLQSADATPDKENRARGWLVGDNQAEVNSTSPNGRPGAKLPLAPAALPAVKVAFDAAKLAGFAAEWESRVSLCWLANRSPVEPALVSAEDFLALLYSEGEHVVIFTDQESQGQALWPLDRPPLRAPDGVWFLAQPTDGKKHYNPRTGNPSRRSEENVLAWRFLVIESDTTDPRHWMAALVQLPLCIAALYTSGGRSIHALVRLDAPSKAAWDRERDALKPALVVLGADPCSMSAVRLTRLPGCQRGTRRQRLLYLNPDPVAMPICEHQPLRDGPAEWLRCHEKAKLLPDGLNDPNARFGLLPALLYYGHENRACASAAAYWQDLA